MKKINFEVGTQVNPAKVTIDNVEHEVIPAVWEGNTPLSPFVLNKMQDNIEEETKTTQTTEVSEELTINNCAGVKGKLDIKSGKSIQEEGTPSSDNIIPIRNVGDNINIFDKDNANMLNAYINGDVITSATNNRLIYISVKENKAYSIKKHKGLGVLRVATSINIPKIGDTVNNVQNFSSLETTYTIPSGEKYLIVFLYRDADMNGGFTLQDILDNLKIEESSIPTPYTPYNCGSADFQLSNQDNSQSRIVSFPFTAGQRLHIGDYLASDGIHQKRKTLVLDGTETINIGNTGSSNWFYLINVGISNLNSDILPLCSHYKGAPIYNANTEQGILLIGTGEFRIRYGTEDTIYNFKSYLAEQYANGTPVTIEYELAEEEIIPYTPEQKEAYYQLQHLLMYEGYTNITCIDEIKPDIQLTYWYNNELNKSYGERFDKVEDSINELEKGEIYSTEEQVIGTWLGKPLYRKVITGNFSNGSTLLSNVDKFVSFSGNCKFTGDTWERSLPYGDKALSFVNIQKQAGSTNVIIAIMVGGSSSSIIDSEIALEYTKTTD